MLWRPRPKILTRNIFLLPREGRGLSFFLLLEAGGALRLEEERRKRGRIHRRWQITIGKTQLEESRKDLP
jgi:hypothetical protein